MTTEDTMTAKVAAEDRRGPKWQGLSLYFVLLWVQTVGFAILFCNFVPLYRQNPKRALEVGKQSAFAQGAPGTAGKGGKAKP